MTPEENPDKHITDQQRAIVNRNLTEAVINDDRPMIELCLQKGADINTRNNGWYDRTPLMTAVAYRRTGQVEYLLAKKPDLFATDSQGSSAFDIAEQLDDRNTKKAILTLLLKELPDGAAAAEKTPAAEPDAEPAAGAEAGRDVTLLKPIEFSKHKKPEFKL
jgi:ankyrin repeat protein